MSSENPMVFHCIIQQQALFSCFFLMEVEDLQTLLLGSVTTLDAVKYSHCQDLVGNVDQKVVMLSTTRQSDG
jgi:hypothetical protein